MRFTSPSGRTYTWDKPEPPTQDDIDQIVSYDSSLDQKPAASAGVQPSGQIPAGPPSLAHQAELSAPHAAQPVKLDTSGVLPALGLGTKFNLGGDYHTAPNGDGTYTAKSATYGTFQGTPSQITDAAHIASLLTQQGVQHYQIHHTADGKLSVVVPGLGHFGGSMQDTAGQLSSNYDYQIASLQSALKRAIHTGDVDEAGAIRGTLASLQKQGKTQYTAQQRYADQGGDPHDPNSDAGWKASKDLQEGLQKKIYGEVSTPENDPQTLEDYQKILSDRLKNSPEFKSIVEPAWDWIKTNVFTGPSISGAIEAAHGDKKKALQNLHELPDPGIFGQSAADIVTSNATMLPLDAMAHLGVVLGNPTQSKLVQSLQGGNMHPTLANRVSSLIQFAGIVAPGAIHGALDASYEMIANAAKESSASKAALVEATRVADQAAQEVPGYSFRAKAALPDGTVKPEVFEKAAKPVQPEPKGTTSPSVPETGKVPTSQVATPEPVSAEPGVGTEKTLVSGNDSKVKMKIQNARDGQVLLHLPDGKMPVDATLFDYEGMTLAVHRIPGETTGAHRWAVSEASTGRLVATGASEGGAVGWARLHIDENPAAFRETVAKHLSGEQPPNPKGSAPTPEAKPIATSGAENPTNGKAEQQSKPLDTGGQGLGEGKASTEPKHTITVNDRQFELSGPSLDRYNELKDGYGKTLEHIERNKKGDPEMAAKRKKAAGMQFSAELRELVGARTPKEESNIRANAAKLGVGTPVETPNGEGVVSRQPAFGKVKVRYADGSELTHEVGDVKSVQEPKLDPSHEGVSELKGDTNAKEVVREESQAGPSDQSQGSKTPSGDTQTEDSKATGLARRFEDIERKEAGKDPTAPKGTSVKFLADEGEKAVESGKVDPKKVIREDRPLTPEETAAVTHYKRSLANESDELAAKVKDADPATKLVIAERQNQIAEEMDHISDSAQRTRQNWHAGGQALQIAFEPDYSIADIRSRAKAANLGDMVSGKAQDMLDTMGSHIAALKTELATAKAQISDLLNKKTVVKTAPKEKLINRLSVLTGGAPEGATGSSVSRSKQAGGIMLPSPENVAAKLSSDARSLARTYISEGAKSVDEVVARFRKDLPHLTESDVLDLLSDKYKSKRAEMEAAKMRVEDQLSALRRSAQWRQKTVIQKAAKAAYDVVNTMSRSLKLAIHASAPFMQGRKVLFSDTKAWAKSWLPMLKGYASGANAEYAQLGRFKTDPFWAKMQKGGIEEILAKPHGSLTEMEETLSGDLVNHIPVLGKVFEHSGAAFNGFLNEARFQMVKDLVKLDPNNAAYVKDVVRNVGAITGRSSITDNGTIGAAIQKTAPTGAFVFSPRYTLSKWDWTSLGPLRKATTGIGRTQIAMTYGKIAAANIAIAGLMYKFFGAKTDLDPRSQSFGHMKIGHQEVDLFAQEGEPIRLVAQTFIGKKLASGKVTGPSLDPLKNYVMGKLTPVAKLPITLTQGEFNAKGEMTNPAIGKQDTKKPPFDYGQLGSDLFEPITIQSSRQEYAKGATAAPFLNPLGIMTREARKPSGGGNPSTGKKSLGVRVPKPSIPKP